MPHKKKIILVLGAGFAGIAVARSLCKKLGNYSEFHITIVDQKNAHIYTPDLYEIATAFHKEITEECLMQLRETVATPLSKIISGKPIHFVRDTVMTIDTAAKKLHLRAGGALKWDYLVIALGSVVNYYNIPGLQQFSYPLKTLTDAIAINCHIDHYLQTFWKREEQKRIEIVIGGGGATGVEFACELPGYVEKLCEKYRYPREHIGITLIEATENLTGQNAHVTSVILKRFQKLGVKALLSTFIKQVTAETITVESADKENPRAQKTIPRDILIWTGGVMPNPLIRASFTEVAKNGALPVNRFLQYAKILSIYSAGDDAYFVDEKSQKPAPMLAQVAVQQGEVIAHNIVADILGRAKKPYQLKLKGVIVPLGGQYAILKIGNVVLRGFFVWVLRRLVDLWYALKILPFWYALKKWIHDTNVFIEND